MIKKRKKNEAILKKLFYESMLVGFGFSIGLRGSNPDLSLKTRFNKSTWTWIWPRIGPNRSLYMHMDPMDLHRFGSNQKPNLTSLKDFLIYIDLDLTKNLIWQVLKIFDLHRFRSNQKPNLTSLKDFWQAPCHKFR